MNFERNKKVDIVFALIAIGSLIWMFYDYDSWTSLDRKPTGKGAKMFMMLVYFLDKIGGKIFTISNPRNALAAFALFAAVSNRNFTQLSLFYYNIYQRKIHYHHQ